MIYLNDSYVKEFHAPIVAVEEEKIITADSCFYAQSGGQPGDCLLYTSPSPRDQRGSRMPSSA